MELKKKKKILMICIVSLIITFMTLVSCLIIIKRSPSSTQEKKQYTYNVEELHKNLLTIYLNEKEHIKIDSDYTQLETIEIENEEYIKNIDYTIKPENTIITFTEKGIEKLKKYKKEILNIVIKYQNNKVIVFKIECLEK